MTDCYRLSNVSDILDRTGIGIPCGTSSSVSEFVPCCHSGDSCLQFGQASICHYTHELVGGSGCYTGGCTDPNVEDVSCAKECTDLLLPDVVYNGGDFLWHCCGSNNDTNNLVPTCQSPTNETFQAPAPSALATYSVTSLTATLTTISSSATISASSQISTTADSALTSSASTSPASTTSTGLHPSALAGIAIGSIIGAGLLLALFAFVLWQHFKRKHLNTHKPANQNQPKTPPDNNPATSRRPQELDGGRHRAELENVESKQELPSR